MEPTGMRTLMARIVLAAGAILVPATVLVYCGGGGGSGSSGTPPSGPAETITQCCSSGTPTGYFKINDSWSSTSCGSPSSITYNVCTYRLWQGKPVNTTMTICAGQTLPGGWGQINSNWNPTACGHPSSIVDNIWTVRRNF